MNAGTRRHFSRTYNMKYLGHNISKSLTLRIIYHYLIQTTIDWQYSFTSPHSRAISNYSPTPTYTYLAYEQTIHRRHRLPASRTMPTLPYPALPCPTLPASNDCALSPAETRPAADSVLLSFFKTFDFRYWYCLNVIYEIRGVPLGGGDR